MTKASIIKYNRSWIRSQENYLKIDGIPEGNHVPYPEPLQKLIVTHYCKWNLEVINEGEYKKKIDFRDKGNHEILVEMKSTTSLNGAVGLTDTQADKSNYLIWFFADASTKEITIKKIEITEEERPRVQELYKGTTHAISTVFSEHEKAGKTVDKVTFNMITMR